MTHLRRCLSACLLVAACSGEPVAPVTAADVAVADAVDATDLGSPVDAPALTDLGNPVDAPAAVDAPVVAPAYPEGPYGNRLGNVLANLSWEGYVNPTGEALSNTLPYTMTSLQALRGSGRGYALVHVSEFL